MKLTLNDNNTFEVFINNLYMDFDKEDKNLYEILKKILLNLRKKYALDIYGYFETNIYYIENIGTVLKFHKIDNDSFDIKNIDLKINLFKNEDYNLIFTDYYIIKDYKNFKYENGFYYINSKEIKKEDIIRLSDYYEIEICK